MKSDRPAHKPTRFERTLLPEVETLVTIKATPNAVCHLRHETDEEHQFQLDADEHGIVRFHPRPQKDAQPIELALDCSDTSGARVRQPQWRCDLIVPGPPLAVAALSQGWRASYASRWPATRWPVQPRAAGAWLPTPPGPRAEPRSLCSLAEEGLAAVHPGQAHKGRASRCAFRHEVGEGCRCPVARSHPAATAADRGVSHPAATAAAGCRCPEAGLSHPPVTAADRSVVFNQNSNNWSGAYLTNPNSQFFWIEADWTVPGASTDSGYAAVAEWIGLNNSGSDLYQAGSDSECWNVFGAGPSRTIGCGSRACPSRPGAFRTFR